MNRIKLLRIEHGLKQVDLAKYLNVSQSTLSGWESGLNEPDFANLKKMIELFNVSIDYLLEVANDPTPPDKKAAKPEPDIKWGDFGISFHGTPTEEDKEMIVDSVNFAMEQRRKRNEAKAKEQRDKK
jgi:transcriptional regulator with XRE-family HTH domain